MDFSNLTDHEIKALLMQYDSELKKLNFQIQVVQNTIHHLHQRLSGIPVTPTEPSNTELPPVGTEQIKTTVAKTIAPESSDKTLEHEEQQEELAPTPIKKKRSKEYPPKKKKKRKYTKNNPWPAFIMNQFAEYQQALSSNQIYSFGIEFNEIQGYESSEKEVRAMISRALTTLANKKKQLAKLKLDKGRGYNYAPISWLDENGQLPEKYQP